MSLPLDFSKIRLICSDIDGTLLQKETALPQAIKEEVWRLHKKGITFTFSTGRLPYEVDGLFDGLPANTPYVAGNGAVMKRGQEILREYDFVPGPLRELAYRYSARGVTVIFTCGELERPLAETPWSRSCAGIFAGMDMPVEEAVWEQRIQRMFFYHPQGLHLTECRQELEAFEGDFGICSQNDRSIQIAPRGCTKAAGVQMLGEYLGVKREEILCVGDAENDISMIRYAGIGAAVSNGSAALKQAADHVTQGACAEGVLELLRLCGQK